MAIGETVLGAFIQVLFDKLASQEVFDFFCHSKFDQSLVNHLKTLMLAAEKLLLDAEEKYMTHHTVKLWVNELKHWFYRAEEVFDDIASEALRSSLEIEPPKSLVQKLIPSFMASSSFQNTITAQISEIISMLEILLSQKGTLGLTEGSVGKAYHTIPTTFFLEDAKVYGRDQEREKILESLLSGEAERNRISVLVIVGMGGIGKTTLAKVVYNDARVQEGFDLKIWVCVSDQFDISRVTRTILESVTHQSYSASLDLNFLQTELSAKLREKRFLLVLDDLWNENYEEWESLKAPIYVGESGSKIIVTTRDDGVASIMRTEPVFRLKPLSDDDGWCLFSRHTFEVGNLISGSSTEDIGRKIVQKCQGLPLAIKTLGGLLRSTHVVSEWEAILESSLWDLPYNRSSVIPALWLSYHHLPPHLRRCFSYCAIFPKNFKVKGKDLVYLWMAENFLVPTNDKRKIEDIGEEHLRQLQSRSFFEPMDESDVTMHDLMHDLAQFVYGDFLARQELERLSKVSERVRHFSYAVDRYDGISKFEAIHNTKYLRTLLQLWNTQYGEEQKCYLSNRLTSVVVPDLYCLRVLCLPEYQNLMLPQSIGCLKQLRYLNVSRSKIKQLPESVSTLYSLQTLILYKCSLLETLPTDMWRLVSLRHLDIEGTSSLLHMPTQMHKLKNLQTLTDFVVGKSIGSGIEVLRELQDIQDSFTLRRLQNVTVPSDAIDVNLSGRKCILRLVLEFDYKDNEDSEKGREILENLRPSTYLESLTITNYAGTRFPSWLDPGRVDYTNMTSLCLSGCVYCLFLPPIGKLPSLKQLEIEGMDYITRIGHEFYGHYTSGPFAALERLSFKNMKGWEMWSNVDYKGNAVYFPFLKTLLLIDCPKLKGNLPVHLPLIEEIAVEGCAQLGRLLPRMPSIHPLKVAFNFTLITIIELVNLVQLVRLPPELAEFPFLRYLNIAYCKNLYSLANVQLPSTMECLRIICCENLESPPEDMVLLTRLQYLTLRGCPCLRWEMLEFPVPVQKQYKALEYLHLRNSCNNLVAFPLAVFPNIRTLRLLECNSLEKVHIPEGITCNSLTSLSKLELYKCPRLEIIGNAVERGEATVLPAPNLLVLCIMKCKNVRPVLIEQGGKAFIPKLKSLVLDNLDNLGLLKFSCLTILSISGQQAECFPDKGGIALPSSLTKLEISEFPKLRNLNGKALRNLNSIRELVITDCPLLQRLPEEGMPPSLDHLSIFNCLLLEERCQPEKGEDWSKIHHLPCIQINGYCISAAD